MYQHTSKNNFLTTNRKINVGVQIFCKQFAVLLILSQRQGLQNQTFPDALGNDLTGDLVGTAEGQALLHQIVSQSVALMKPPWAAFFMFSGFAVMVASMGAKTFRHIFTVSTASKTASLSSCMSLL